jgi:hypothetical protein
MLVLFGSIQFIAMPCLVNAIGRCLVCSPLFKVPVWLLKESYSLGISSNIKILRKPFNISYNSSLQYLCFYTI